MIFLVFWLLFTQPKSDACIPFDGWVGGERVSETITIPDDAVITKIQFPQAGIWKYYVIEQDTTYIKVFVDHWHVCLYKLRGEGMGLPEFDMQEQGV